MEKYRMWEDSHASEMTENLKNKLKINILLKCGAQFTIHKQTIFH